MRHSSQASHGITAGTITSWPIRCCVGRSRVDDRAGNLVAEDERQRVPRADLAAVEADVGVADAATGDPDANAIGVDGPQIERFQGDPSRSRENQSTCLHAPPLGIRRLMTGSRRTRQGATGVPRPRKLSI